MDTHIAKNIVVKASAVSLIIYPVLLLIAFGLHFDSFADFFDFRFVYVQNTPEVFMSTLSGDQVDRLFLVPHYFGYLAMPFMIISALVLGLLIFEKRPVAAITGVTMVLTGSVFLAGVFAAWLCFAAVGQVPASLAGVAVNVLEKLTSIQGALL